MRKCLTMLLCILLLLSLFETQAFAAEEHKMTYVGSVINPIYEDVDLSKLPSNPVPNVKQPRAITYCSDVYDVEAVLREGLKDREPEIYVYMDSFNTDFLTLEFYDYCYALAMLHTGGPDEGDYLLYHQAGADYYYGESNIGYVLIYVPYYLTDINMERTVNYAVNDLLMELNLTFKSRYEKARGIYQWMCENIQRDEEVLVEADLVKYTAYGALIDRRASSVGFASLFYRLALELGVDTRIIEGMVGETVTAWNIVHQCDKFYYVDAAMDAERIQAGKEYAYFLRGSNAFCVDHTPAEFYNDPEFQALYPISRQEYSHVFDMVVTPPTCTMRGYTTYSCPICSEVYNDDYVNATGHDPKAVEMTAPTCTNSGFTTYACHCGHTYVGEVVPATGHTFGQWYVSKESACNEYGQASKDCANCDAMEHLQLQKADHTYEAVVTPPTMDQQGFTTYTCTGCGDSFVEDYTEKLPVVAQIGEVLYTTLKDALADAKSGDTVILVADAQEEKANLTVDEGVTLNIGQFDIHARSLNVLTGAMITGGEYSQNGDWGKIYLPAASRMVMSGMVVENDGSIGLIPVWDDAASCYVFGGAFFDPSNYIVAVKETEKTLSFKFFPSLRTDLMKGYFQDANEMRDNGLRLVLRLTWPGADESGNINGQAQQDFVYSSEFVKTYMDKLGSARFTFLLTGYDTLVTDAALAEMTITPMFISDNGMVFAGQTVELVDYIGL